MNGQKTPARGKAAPGPIWLLPCVVAIWLVYGPCWHKTGADNGGDAGNAATDTATAMDLQTVLAAALECVPALGRQPPQVMAAMASLAMNIGRDNFCNGSVAKFANAGKWQSACRQIGKIYRSHGGTELPGLVKRREAESRMCLSGLAKGRLAHNGGAEKERHENG